MSLSRLREIAMPIILDYLNRKHSVEIDVNTTNDSQGIREVYTKNNVVTFFLREAKYEITLRPELCFKKDFRYLKHNDTYHDSYHQRIEDFLIPHLHVLKGRIETKEMTREDMNCLINTIKDFEKHFQICQDGKTDCVLSDKDAEVIKDSYNQHLGKRASKNNAAAKKIYAELEKNCIVGAQSFTQAFVTTMLDKYLQPLLINQGLYHSHARGSIEFLKSSITMGLGASYLQTALDAIIRNGIGSLLSKLGVNAQVTENLLSEIGTVVAFTKNPFSLLELSVNGSAAALGQSTAYLVIHALPKLKYEEPPEAELEKTHAHVVEKNISENNGNLRKRF